MTRPSLSRRVVAAVVFVCATSVTVGTAGQAASPQEGRPSPPASAPAKDEHRHAEGTKPEARPAGDANVRTAIERIQERISAEVPNGPGPARPRQPASAAKPPATTSAAAPSVPPTAARAPRVTLEWRVSLTWPAELYDNAAAADGVRLRWR